VGWLAPPEVFRFDEESVPPCWQAASTKAKAIAAAPCHQRCPRFIVRLSDPLFIMGSTRSSRMELQPIPRGAPQINAIGSSTGLIGETLGGTRIGQHQSRPAGLRNVRQRASEIGALPRRQARQLADR